MPTAGLAEFAKRYFFQPAALSFERFSRGWPPPAYSLAGLNRIRRVSRLEISHVTQPLKVSLPAAGAAGKRENAEKFAKKLLMRSSFSLLY